MKGVLYDFTIPKYAAAKALGKRFPSLYYGKPSALSLSEVEEPELPNENWLKVKPVYAGVCGSDMSAIRYTTSPALTPFNSFPSVLGHEIVGIVTEVGSNVKKIGAGERITIDPYIGCEVRGKELCPACEQGMHTLCRYKSGSDAFGPGMILGFCKDLPGGWGESLVVHESMAIPLKDSISDKVAAMSEPLSVGLHAVLRDPPENGEHVLIIGSGMIAFAVIAAIRLLGIDCHITHQTRLQYQKELALKLGVDQGVTNRTELENTVLSMPESARLKPALGREVFVGGFDSVFDCVGSQESLDDALRLARERGSVILVGCAAQIKDLDWSFVWSNELSVQGTHAYAKKETWQGRELTTQELLLELIEEQPDYPLEGLITHEFPLEEYQQAIIVNMNRRQYQSVKTLLRI